MLKKLLLSFFCCVLLTGCSVSKSTKEITFSSWGSVSEVKIIKQLIYNFEKENPDIKVNFMHIPQNYFQKIHLLFASNTAPDVIFINNLHLPLYEQHLEDLNSYIKKDDFYEVALDALSLNKKLLAIPRDLSNLIVYINTDLLPLPNSDWTIETLLNYMQKAKEKGLYGIGYEEDIYWSYPYLTYFGGGLFNNKNENIFLSPTTQKGLNFYKDLKNKYHYAPTKSQVGSSTLAQMFINKQLAMYVSGRWMFPKIKESADFNWKVINFPYGKNPQYTDASGWAISKKSKNKEDAIKLVNFLSSKQSAEFFAKTGLIVPAQVEASKLLDSNEYNQKLFLEVIENTVKTPVSKDYKKTVDKINSIYLK